MIRPASCCCPGTGKPCPSDFSGEQGAGVSFSLLHLASPGQLHRVLDEHFHRKLRFTGLEALGPQVLPDHDSCPVRVPGRLPVGFLFVPIVR